MSARKAGVASGQAVVTGEGLAGRIAEVGDNSARVLFVTDVNSRLPVLVERTRERAILAGDNSASFASHCCRAWPACSAAIASSPRATAAASRSASRSARSCETGEGSVRVRPFADFSRLEFVRVVDYGVTGLVGGGLDRAAATPAGAAGRAEIR